MSYHSKITAQFGADLFKLLGPKADRRAWKSLSAKEQKEILSKIPVYVNTRSLGKYPPLVDVVIFCFNKLVNMGAENPLLGIDLPEYDSLTDAAEKLNTVSLNYDVTNLHDINILVKNAAKQRDVFLKHIFEDIIFRFQPGLVFPGIGRMDSKGRLFVNDAQHRTLACIILGIESAPISYIVSDDEYWDVAQYAAINIHSLIASEFDRYRIRVQRYIAAVEAGLPVEDDDKLSNELHELFEELGVIVLEKSDAQGSKALVCTSIGNMITYRKEYGQSDFTRAVQLVARLWNTSKFQSANAWGLMEFLKYQDPSVDPMLMDYAIQNSLGKRWSKANSGGQVHKTIKDTYKQQTAADAYNSRIPEPLIIAHGIWQVCKKYDEVTLFVEPPWPVGATKFKMALI
jgi:hypothetical protein